MNRIFKALLFILILTLCECKDPVPVIGPYHDPYDDAFKGKNIDYMISSMTSASGILFKDSTKFDKKGSVIYFEENGIQEWKAYDSMGYLTRHNKQDDSPKNFWITYVYQHGTLIQKWNVLKHPEWNFNTNDISYLYNTVIYKFNERGNVIERTDQIESNITTYQYNSQKLLVKKIIKSKLTGVYVGEWNYTYDERRSIETVTFNDNEGCVLKHYFHSGRLDSTRQLGNLLIYSYKYFD